MNKFKLSLIAVLIMLSLYACNFGVQGLGGSGNELGTPCLIAAMRFIPTPSSISGEPSTSPPALPINENDCTDWASSLNTVWEMERTDLSGSNSSISNPFVIPEWDWVNIINDDGQTYCEIGVSVPSEVINSLGMGRWRVTHRLGDWSVTCDEAEITECPTASHDVPILVSHVTMNIDECVQDKLPLGALIDGNVVEYP